jgi:transcriptional regulator with XRE-family HTH domain
MKQQFIDWLHEELRKKGWKPADLAKASGLAPSTISRILNGQVEPSDAGYSKIAKALGEPREKVFRLIGLLPPLPPMGDGPILDEIVNVVKQLTEDEKEEILAYAELRLKRQKDRMKRPRPIEIRPGPSPIIQRVPTTPPGVPPGVAEKVLAAMERLTPADRAAWIEYLLSRREFVLALKQRGVEVETGELQEVQAARTRKAQE